MRDAVLVEWTDSDVANATFQGTAREILRVGFNATFHPMADLIFNPGAPYGGGRADIRLALGGDGEIYVLSKSDGMVRKLTGTRTTGG